MSVIEENILIWEKSSIILKLDEEYPEKLMNVENDMYVILFSMSFL